MGSTTRVLRPGRNRAAATIVLNSVTLVESPTAMSSAVAPTSGAIRPATRSDRWVQSAVFQDLIRSAPHSRSMTSAMRGATEFGVGPSEFPHR